MLPRGRMKQVLIWTGGLCEMFCHKQKRLYRVKCEILECVMVKNLDENV